ncbi:MAG: dicarboxylate/amino acid:cation symporter [Planctomycetota bacterium]
MKFHWKVLLWMLAGILAGLALQRFVPAPAYLGAEVQPVEGGLELVELAGPALRADWKVGDVLTTAVMFKGSRDPERPERRIALATPEDLAAVVDELGNGQVVWFERDRGDTVIATLGMRPDSPRSRWVAPFDFVADLFMSLLKMLIVPIVLSSIIAGVANVRGVADLKRLGGKTFGYYIMTSLLAILVGQILVTLVQPGAGAELGLAALEPGTAPDDSFLDVLKRMIPENVFEALGDNGAMLSIIFFALAFGYAVTRTSAPHGERVRDIAESVFQVMLQLAELVLLLLPYGVFCLMLRVVSQTGFAVFEPLLKYMGVVTLALVLHSVVTLPLVVRFVGRASPRRWFRAMSPALITAFSTSSSSMTLPVTMETVEKRGRVSNKITSFTLPLGATINMDGTALYECIGVIFLAQYYGGLPGSDFELTYAKQALVVVMALLASVGAAGIPSAGLVMMLAILSALGLPLEGAALLLAVDRPLDMLRTVVNVWSDSCGACVIARSEGETGPLLAGEPT